METFVGNTIDIILETHIELAGFSILRMKYIRPDGSAGFWPATVDPSDSTRLIYATSETDLNLRGKWKIQSFVSDAGVRLHGRWAEIMVFQPAEDVYDTTPAPTTGAP